MTASRRSDRPLTTSTRTRHSWMVPALLAILGASGLPLWAADAVTAASAENPAVTSPGAGTASWAQVSELSAIQFLQTSPVDPAVIYAADAQSLWVSQDAGATFTALAGGNDLPGPVTALLIDPLVPSRLYAGTAAHGLLISDDAGRHWRPCGAGLANSRIHALVFSPSDRTCSTIFASHSLDQAGLSVSVDAGASWHVFAPDYAIADVVALDEAFFCAASNPSQGVGFYRYDTTKGWYCVLPEQPRQVLASPADARRLWFSSRDAGISLSENAGVATRKVGPPDIDVEAMAIDLTSTGQETVYAFAPQSKGVLASSDFFATYTALTSGLEPSEWTQEGARLAISCDGSELYACANGNVYRYPLQAPATHLTIHAIPALLAAGGGPLVIQASAAPGAHLIADCTALGGSAELVLGADGHQSLDAAGLERYSGRLDQIPGTITAGIKVVPVHDQDADGLQHHGRVSVRILPASSDILMWDASHHDLGAARLQGAWVGSRITLPGSATPCVHLHIDGPGKLIMPLSNPAGESISVRDHALITFAIRSNQPGPLPLHLSVHDNGQGSGAENTQPSNELSIDRYLPVVDGDFHIVSVPISELLEGSTCSPTLIDLTLSCGDGIHREIDLLPMRLLAQTGPTLSDVELLPLGQGRLSVLVTANGRDVRPTAASVRLGAEALPLTLVPRPAFAAAGQLPWSEPPPGESTDPWQATFTGIIDASALGSGGHSLELAVTDPHGVTLTTEGFVLEDQPPGAIPGLLAASDPAQQQASLAQAPPFTGADTGRSLTGRLLWDGDGLDLQVEVVDPVDADYTLKESLKANALGNVAQSELFIREEREGAHRRHVQIIWTTAGAKTWCDGASIPCTGQRTASGYTVQAHLPIILRAHGLPGPGSIGRSVRLQWVLTTGDHHLLTWSGGHSDKPEADGLALVLDPTGPLHLEVLGTGAHELVLAADRPLADESLKASAWALDQVAPLAVELSSDRRQVRLCPAQWPLPASVQISAPGVHAADGATTTAALFWPSLDLSHPTPK